MIRYNKGKLRESGKKQEYYQRVGYRHEKRRDKIVYQRTLLVLLTLMNILAGVALEAVETEAEQQHATENLQKELILRRIYKLHHETHAKACKQCIEQVTGGRSETGNKAIPPALVKRTLYA